MGIQTSTTSAYYLLSPTTIFIPTTQIQDIVIHEAFKGLEVRFYLAVIVEEATEVVVVFPVCWFLKRERLLFTFADTSPTSRHPTGGLARCTKMPLRKWNQSWLSLVIDHRRPGVSSSHLSSLFDHGATSRSVLPNYQPSASP